LILWPARPQNPFATDRLNYYQRCLFFVFVSTWVAWDGNAVCLARYS
jgi:hypothetical protein